MLYLTRIEEVYNKAKNTSHSNENIEITIFSITGKLLIREAQAVSGNEIKIATDLSSGVYVLKVTLADESAGVQRLIISR